MIYEIYLDNNIIHYPGDEKCVVKDPVLTQALNDAGTLEFEVPSDHPAYDLFEVRKSMVQVVKNNGGSRTEIFNGEVREVNTTMDFTRKIYAVGELAFLFDSIQPQAVYQGTIGQMLQSMIQKHNSQVEERKKFTLGGVEDLDPYIYRFTNREDTLTAIREKLCDTLGGYLKIRKENGKRYLDFVSLENYGSYCTQTIEFGENLMDYSANLTAEDIATAVIPLGAIIDEDKRTAKAVNGLDEYLTIEGVNNGNDFVYIQSAVNKFGWVRVVKHWDDVTVAANLKAKAEAWLQDAQYAQMILELNAFDMGYLSVDYESFRIGDTVKAIARPFGMETTFPVQKMTTHLTDASKNYITLGNTMQLSYTAQASKAATTIEEKIPKTYDILETAKASSMQILESANGGCVVFRFNEAGQIESFAIADNMDKDEALREWLFNINGIGYRSRPTKRDWQPSDLKTAITMDGKIVANDLITGTINAADINGVNITGVNMSGSSIVSERADGSKVTISGGALKIINTADSFLELQYHGSEGTDDNRITLGATTWSLWKNGQSWFMTHNAIQRLFEDYQKYN